MGRLTHTVSGDIAYFRTPSRVPIDSLKFHFLPKQASGTPTPENPIPIYGWTGLNGYGSGKNIISLSDFQYIDNSSNIDLTITDNTMKILCKKNGNDWLKSSQEAKLDIPKAWRGKPIYFGVESITLETENKDYQRSTIVCEFRDENNTFISDPTVVSVGDGSTTYARKFTIPSDATVMKIYFRIAQNVSSYGVSVGDYIIFNNFYMRYPSDTYGYTKYEGEKIPITFPVAGTNKLDPSAILNNHGHFSLNNGIWSNVVTDERTYIQLAVQLWKTTGTYIKTLYVDYVKTTGRHVLTFTVDDSNGHYICLKHNGTKKDFILLFPWTFGLHQYTISLDVLSADPTTIGGVQLTNIQLEPGDTAHAFEPYSSDNTFYGGYSDPVAGEIVAEWGEHIFDGTEDKIRVNYRSSERDYALMVYTESGILPGNSGGAVVCNILKTTNGAHSSNATYPRPTSSGFIMDFARTSICDLTSEEFQALTDAQMVTTVKDYLTGLYANGTPMVSCYKLANPIHIPIPAQDLKAYLDNNNFWSDANDITEVTYAITESKDILETRKRISSYNIGDYIKDGLILWMDGIDKGDISGAWIDKVAGHVFTSINGMTVGSNYIALSRSNSQMLENATFNGVNYRDGTIEVVISDYDPYAAIAFAPSVERGLCFGFGTSGSVIYGISVVNDGNYMNHVMITNPNHSGKIFSINYENAIVDGERPEYTENVSYFGQDYPAYNHIGGRIYTYSSGTSPNYFDGKIYAIRVYDRKLSLAEMLHNQRIDNRRFKLGLNI